MAKLVPVLCLSAHEVRAYRADGVAEVWHYGEPTAVEATGEETSPAAEEGTSVEQVMSLAEVFKAAVKTFSTHEFIVALPLADLLVKVVKTPTEERERRDELAGEMLDKTSPFPDEWLVTSSETVTENEQEITSFTAALPEATRSKYDDALDTAKVRVIRTDVLTFGWIRTLWPEIGSEGRKLVVMTLDGACDILVLNNGALVAARGIAAFEDSTTLSREVTLTTLSAGEIGPLLEVVYITDGEANGEILGALGAFGPVRTVKTQDPYGGATGIVARVAENGTLDVTPETWSNALEESRFRRNLFSWLAVAISLWLLIMGAFFGVPTYFEYRTDAVKEVCKRHKPAYEAVRKMKNRVNLVKRYSDHSRSALEILKAVSDRLPTEVTLTQFSYQTLQKLNLAGESEDRQPVLEFKDDLVATKAFAEVTLKGPTQNRSGLWKFSIEATFETDEEQNQ